MEVVEKIVSQCEDGDILSEDLFNENGIKLWSKDTVIDEYLKEKLVILGIFKVKVYSSLTEFENNNESFRELKRDYHSAILETKNLLNDLASGKPLDTHKVTVVTHQIYKNININEAILKCMMEIRSFDEYTYVHCVNTAFYAMLIGKWLKLSDTDIITAIQAGLLHDIGKAKIPKEVLNKEGKLTDEEYKIIKQHPILGFEMVANIEEIDEEIKLAILLHHERMDGSGYPFNINADEMSFHAKIIAVADVFDAMTSDRVYRKRATPFEAFGMFNGIGFGIFDTNIVNEFLRHMYCYYIGANVILNNGKMGQVVYIPPHDITNPIIRVGEELLDLSKDRQTKIYLLV